MKNNSKIQYLLVIVEFFHQFYQFFYHETFYTLPHLALFEYLHILIHFRLGLKPVLLNLLVGDFDSYQGGLPRGVEIIRLNPEKDDTDTLHCVKTALERGFTDFILLAATGGRLDHTLANLSVTEYLTDRGTHCIILSENEKTELLTEGRHIYSGCKGLTFSVFPYGCQRVVLSYKGAYYPLDHGVLTHSTAMGVSNVFTADTSEITVHEGRVLLIINTRKDI